MWTERQSGQTNQRSHLDHRSPFERDKTRVIHCPAFRRLQRKTQILGTDEGDFHRTRLTHSLEVASIGVSLVRHLHHHTTDAQLTELLPSDDLISTICLLHDMGHPPFGHGGEIALNDMMRHHGGFEGNGQTLRLLTKIECSYGPFGLDLTRRVLLGVLKYPAARAAVVAMAAPEALLHRLPPKAYFETEQAEVDWLLSPLPASERALFQSLAVSPTAHAHGKTRYQSLDCAIMNIADDIAYGVHDLEDAIHLKLIHRDQCEMDALVNALQETPLPQAAQFIQRLFHPDLHQRKEAIGELVNYLVTSVTWQSVDAPFETPLLKQSVALLPAAEQLLTVLVNLVYQLVIDSLDARTAEFGGQTIIKNLFTALRSHPMSLLTPQHRALYQAATDQNLSERILCDYIANMTDESAYRWHERLFGFHHPGGRREG